MIHQGQPVLTEVRKLLNRGRGGIRTAGRGAGVDANTSGQLVSSGVTDPGSEASRGRGLGRGVARGFARGPGTASMWGRCFL